MSNSVCCQCSLPRQNHNCFPHGTCQLILTSYAPLRETIKIIVSQFKAIVFTLVATLFTLWLHSWLHSFTLVATVFLCGYSFPIYFLSYTDALHKPYTLGQTKNGTCRFILILAMVRKMDGNLIFYLLPMCWTPFCLFVRLFWAFSCLSVAYVLETFFLFVSPLLPLFFLCVAYLSHS